MQTDNTHPNHPENEKIHLENKGDHPSNGRPQQSHPHSPHKSPQFSFGNFNIVKLSDNHFNVPCHTGMMKWPIHSFLWLEQGEIYLLLDNDSKLVQKNEMIIIPASTPFSIKYYNNTIGFMGGFSSDFLADLSHNITKKFQFLGYYNTNVYCFDENNSPRIASLLTTMHSLYNNNSSSAPLPERLIRAYLLCLLEELNEIDSLSIRNQGKINSNQGNNNQSPMGNSIVHRFFDLLFSDDNLCLKPSDYAEKLCVSANHLNKVVRQTTNKALSVWIDERIILDAKVLISNTDLSINEIAERVGILDPSYFARKFKQLEGLSPSEFKKKVQRD